MAQSRVTDFYNCAKRNPDIQQSRKRKLAVATGNEGTESVSDTTRPVGGVPRPGLVGVRSSTKAVENEAPAAQTSTRSRGSSSIEKEEIRVSLDLDE